MTVYFTTNALMIIKVPVINLNGMHDNGFAHISTCSENPNEKEVLFNAFNTFKILSFQIVIINEVEVHQMIVEYGGIKQVEDKIRKSENLLES